MIITATSSPGLRRLLRRVRQHLGDVAVICARQYRAAAIYEQLRGLSDAELTRRGFSRATLAWDLHRMSERQT